MTSPSRPPPSAEMTRLLEHVRGRAAALGPAELRARVRAAAAELDAALTGVTEPEARRTPLAGEWSLAQVVDHVAQTTIRGADELRHLLAGRRPPAPPVYEALTSAAASWAPWAELLDGLRSANHEFDAQLAAAENAPASGPDPRPTARAILVVNRALPGGGTAPELFPVEIDWREYAVVQRLHLLDHRGQVKKLRAAALSG